MDCIKIGVLRETKTPPDRRVSVPPARAAEISRLYPNVDIVVQPSANRCFSDEEYRAAGVNLQEDLSDCDWLLGVKEVHPSALIPGKKYLFFAHVAKCQMHNRPLLLELLEKKISLVDYEYLKDQQGYRLIAFGRWAGIVGAYNGLRAWGLKTGQFRLKPANQCHDRMEMEQELLLIGQQPMRILVTGGGRVAQGSMETLERLGFPVISAEQYLSEPDRTPAICRIDPVDYVETVDGQPFEWNHFCQNPKSYRSTFDRYSPVTDLLIAAHYWDPDSPRLWEPVEMADPGFRIRVIADISCDINGSVPSTIRATTIANPYYDWDKAGWRELPPFSDPQAVTMMTIDNLPGELPRDASDEFSSILIEKVFPCLLGDDPCGVIHQATITCDARLNDPYTYLDSFVRGV